MAELPQVESATVRAINEARVAEHEHHRSAGLTPSDLGQECQRKGWYTFRWAHEAEQLDGRKLRLFATGHMEEDRLIADLRRAGVQVWDRDPANPEKQIPVRLLGGHVRGKLDGEAEGVPEAPKTRHVVEAKSHNDKSFKELKRKGVKEAKPLHFAQMQIYMHGRGLTRALYVAVNKNDDEIYTERVEHDAALCLQLLARAERIVTADRAPAKAFEDPTSKMAWACNYCPAKPQCHDGAFAPRNCRTCLHSTAHLDGDARWSCARHQRDLTLDEQRAGCPYHLFVPDLVPGEQVDASETAETVTYLLADGATWQDGHRIEAAA